MNYWQRIYIPQDTEHPVSVSSFMAAGQPGIRNTAIVSYDEIYTLINETGKAMAPFVTDYVDSNLGDADLVTIRVPAGKLRFLNAVFKNVKL